MMARIIKSNTLSTKMTPQKISVSDSYSKYLRVKKQECSENTLKIYADMGPGSMFPVSSTTQAMICPISLLMFCALSSMTMQ